MLAVPRLAASWLAGAESRTMAKNARRLGDSGGGNVGYKDSWDGYESSRRRCFETLRSNAVNDVIVLTGSMVALVTGLNRSGSVIPFV